MHIFRHVSFQKVDALANGLDDDIAKEKSDSGAINLAQDLDSNDLVSFWDKVVKDVEHDPDWFDFTNE